MLKLSSSSSSSPPSSRSTTDETCRSSLHGTTWRPFQMVEVPRVGASRHTSSKYAVWPIHDLIVTVLCTWILPTQMWKHLVRFAVVLVLLWSTVLWILLQQQLTTLPISIIHHIERRSVPWWPWMMSLPVILLLAVSIWWMYWYYHTIFYAIGKPWMDPQVPSMNRLEMHVPLRFFDNVYKARRAACMPHMVATDLSKRDTKKKDDDKNNSHLTQNVWLLDSMDWRFQLVTTVEEGLDLVQRDIANGSDTAQWSTITVPGHWMLQGFDDIPIYTNKKYPIPCTPPVVPRQNPTGVYKLEIDCSKVWNDKLTTSKGDEYTLMIHGMESACYAYWNNHFLGFGKDSRLPSEFFIPNHLVEDVSTLYLVVIRWSDGSFMEDQDHWWMAGLHRSVELIRRPARANILDYRVKATATRELTLAVQLRPSVKSLKVEARLYEDCQRTANGEKWSPAQTALWSQTKSLSEIEMKTSSTTCTMFLESSTLHNVQLWTAERPNLYTLLLIQSDATTDETLQIESCRVGFRSLDIQNDGILRVNGERITICGINRHEHDPDHGKVVSIDRMIQDIVTLKQNNFNAIRTSHYPTHSSFYRLCDFYGMYVVDEANIETDGMKPMGRLAIDWGWESMFVSRVQRMVERDWNHACIIFWSLGNESGRGRNLLQARRAILELDTTRPICYEGGGSWAEGVGRTELTDIVCPMYPDVYQTEALALRKDEDRPVILCEYSHSMNNSNGNLHLYWEKFWSSKCPRLQGGFIWDMIDQGLRKYDATGREFYAYGGDFGDAINDRQFCINGMFSPEREPHPSVAEIKYLQQPAVLSLPDSCSSAVLLVPEKIPNPLVSLLEPSREPFHILLRVVNRYSFQTLGHLQWKWKFIIEYHPDPVLEGFAKLTDELLTIDYNSILPDLVQLKPPKALGNVFLNVEGSLTADASWAKAGHVIVSEQFPVRCHFKAADSLDKSDAVTSPQNQKRLEVDDDAKYIYVSRDDDKPPFVVVDKQSGNIKSIRWRGQNVLHGTGIRPNFTRATTDNDRGGMELVLDFLRLNWAKPLLQIVSRKLFSYEMHWRDHGVSQDAPPSSICTKCTIIPQDASLQSVRIEAYCSIRATSSKIIFNTIYAYTILASGEIKIETTVVPDDRIKSIPSLPRVGLALALNPLFYRIKYFGKGPQENYVDRNLGAKMGLWETSPSEMRFDYIVPSENGSRSGCKWASFEYNGGGLVVSTDPDKDCFSFSALLHTASELHEAPHTCDLVKRTDGKSPVHVNVDHRLMGVGGDVSWFPCVYPDFVVPAVGYKYRTGNGRKTVLLHACLGHSGK